MKQRRPRDRATRSTKKAGLALLLALGALTVVGMVSIALVHFVLRERRQAASGTLAIQADDAAAFGALQLLANWHTAPYDTIPVGGTVATQVSRFGTSRTTSSAVRLTPHLWWSVGQGDAGDSLTRTQTTRRWSLLLRKLWPQFPQDAALTVRDSLELRDLARVSGSDSTVGAWSAGCTPAPVAGVSAPTTGHVCDGSCGATPTRIVGAPPIRTDTATVDSTTYRRFGDDDWGTLTARATKVLAGGQRLAPRPSLTSGHCDRSDPLNWGDPHGGACSTYAPVVHVRGDLQIDGVGQGILLVDGDLTLGAGAAFHGIVIVRDDIVTSGSGGTIVGLALAEDTRPGTGDHSVLAGRSAIVFSRCTISGIAQRNARLLPAGVRAWARLP